MGVRVGAMGGRGSRAACSGGVSGDAVCMVMCPVPGACGILQCASCIDVDINVNVSFTRNVSLNVK